MASFREFQAQLRRNSLGHTLHPLPHTHAAGHSAATTMPLEQGICGAANTKTMQIELKEAQQWFVELRACCLPPPRLTIVAFDERAANWISFATHANTTCHSMLPMCRGQCCMRTCSPSFALVGWKPWSPELYLVGRLTGLSVCTPLTLSNSQIRQTQTPNDRLWSLQPPNIKNKRQHKAERYKEKKKKKTNTTINK